MTPPPDERVPSIAEESAFGRLTRFCLTRRAVVMLALAILSIAALITAPFDWDLGPLPRNPVPVDAIPDIGANQQIVFTTWPGRGPREVDDQITYPLSAAMLNVSGVRTIRSSSMFGFSSIYVIFDERVDFFECRSRLLEKLASLTEGRDYPVGVKPTLGPEATSLGQVFWYTLEGRDPHGRPAGGWDLEELRTCQDWIIRYGLLAVEGVAETASIGGFVREYQVDVDPDALRAYRVTLQQVYQAVRASNLDVGAQTIELNNVEYFVRGVGYIRGLDDIADAVVTVRDHTPVLVRHVARVTVGPASRRGALDKDGAGAVGGVVVAAFGENPQQVIRNVKTRIDQIAPTLPAKTLKDGTVSRITIVPFYDRTGLISETLGTLQRALTDEILITVVVVVAMLGRLGGGLLISSLLPAAVGACFVAMKTFGVDANIVALAGIAIAIGAMVDMGVVICENVLRRLREAPRATATVATVYAATVEVGPAVLTAVATTVAGFLPVFAMAGERGKLFRPLAYTKTFALIAAAVIALTVLPPAICLLLRRRLWSRRSRAVAGAVLAAAGAAAAGVGHPWLGAAAALVGAYLWGRRRFGRRIGAAVRATAVALVAAAGAALLARHWEPLGVERGPGRNLLFTAGIIAVVLGFFRLVQWTYPTVLSWCLRHKGLFLAGPTALVMLGATIWLGFDTVAGPAVAAAKGLGLDPHALERTVLVRAGRRALPGLQSEETPPLDEGSFLWMPSISPHGSIGAAVEFLSLQDRAFAAIPEVESAVGKIGRVDSALDPAPISMVETVINYTNEYRTDAAGRRVRFAFDESAGDFRRDNAGALIPDPRGRPYRQWRDAIRSPDDIWNEIVRAGRLVGLSSAPRLQPIETRRIMLQTGMRSRMGMKIFAADLKTIERVGVDLERLLKQAPAIRPETVAADRQVTKPYLVIDTTTADARAAMARLRVNPNDVLTAMETAVGGALATTTVEAQQRFPVRVRYPRELRHDIDAIARTLVPTAAGAQVPLGELVDIRYEVGPQSVKREEGLMVGYVIFDAQPGYGEIDAVEACRSFVDKALADGRLRLPAGVRLEYNVAGKSVETYAAQQKQLYLVLAAALLIIFILLYLQFQSTATAMLVFAGVFVAWAGGFLLLGLYGTEGFLDFSLFGVNMRELFAIRPIKMSVAVWVGFLALFGIATDDGVVMATYLKQAFADGAFEDIAAIRRTAVAAGRRRVRPCLMTTATTVLALIPVLTSTGRGADVMVPMAIPSVGGMTVAVLTMFVTPVLYCWMQERRFKRRQRRRRKNLLSTEPTQRL